MGTETNRDQSKLRVLAVMEASTVSGPAKNLIEFCRRARAVGGADDGGPRSVEISIATFQRGPEGEAPSKFVAAARESGIAVDVIRERFRFDTRALAQLRAVVERREPDIIQTHQVKSHFLLKLSGLWRRHPWIAFHHGYTATDLKMRLYNQLNRWSLPSARRVVTVCHAFSHQLTREGVAPDRIFVQHNSINANGAVAADATGAARALRERFRIGPGERVVLAVGRLSREKAHADLVAALGRLRRESPDIDFRLVVVGEGPEQQAVESATGAEGIAGRVVFAGQTSDVRPFYALADVMVLPSHSEGSPNVLLEAMAAGVPVVATAVGGVPEMVEHEDSALLVAPHDAGGMAAAIARVLTDDALARRLAANASALVATRYSPETYARSVVGLYRALAGARAEVASRP